MTKCVPKCIGKYVRGSRIEDAVIETKVLNKIIVERFFKWDALCQIAKSYINFYRCNQAFLETHGINK